MAHYLISVAVRDEPGALARVTRLVASWHINLEGVVADPAGLRLLSNDYEPVSRALDETGLLYRIEEVREVIVDDKPGALAELCRRLADAGVNIENLFGVAGNRKGQVFLALDDWVRAAPILALYSRQLTMVAAGIGEGA